MEFITKKRKSYLTDGSLKKKVPYSPELYNFITQSRKCQTLYMNCEGSHSRRVVNLKDKNTTLENFVYCTLYFNEGNDWHSEQDFMKREHVEQIVDKMITTSKNFNLEEEIHFGVVWVYYFLHEDKTQKSTPVFKIYQRKSGNEAVFLDVFLTLYESWDSYLDRAEFPQSLLCMPRQGEYCFLSYNDSKDKRLDLEFFCAERVTRNKAGRFFAADFVPFSQNAVRPWLIKIKYFCLEKWEQIKRIAYIFWNNAKDFKGTFFNVAVFAFCLWMKLVENNISLDKAWESLSVSSLMFLNTRSQERPSEGFLTPKFLSDILSASFAECQAISNAFSPFSDLHYEATRLVKLLRNRKKVWKEILRSFCNICRKSHSILLAVSRVIPLPQTLNCLLLLLNFTSALLETDQSKNNSSWEIMKSEELVSSTSVKPRNIISNFDLSDNQIESCEALKSSDTIRKSVTQKAIENMALEKAVSNLPMIETTSAEEVENQLREELREKLQQNPPDVPAIRSTLLLEKKDDQGIFLLRNTNTSLPSLTYEISRLIGREFFIEPEETFVHKVNLKSGSTAGILFFPQEHSVVGLFSLEAIREQRGRIPLEMTELVSRDTL